MNLKSVRNYAAAALIGASTLAGTLVKVPRYEARQAQKAVEQAAQILKERQAAFKKDSVAFASKQFKTAADSAAYDKSRLELCCAFVDDFVANLKASSVHSGKTSLIKAFCEDITRAVTKRGENLSDKEKLNIIVENLKK